MVFVHHQHHQSLPMKAYLGREEPKVCCWNHCATEKSKNTEKLRGTNKIVQLKLTQLRDKTEPEHIDNFVFTLLPNHTRPLLSAKPPRHLRHRPRFPGSRAPCETLH